MANRILISLLLIVISNTVSAAAKIEHWQSAQGAKIYFVQADALPMVDIQVIFDAGSARDGQQFGLAALTSALLDTGAGQWNADQIAQRFESVGANFGTSVSSDNASLSLRTLTEPALFDKALETMHVILTKPKFNKADFLREQNRTLAASNSGKNHPPKSPAKHFPTSFTVATLTPTLIQASRKPSANSSRLTLPNFIKSITSAVMRWSLSSAISVSSKRSKPLKNYLTDLPTGQKPETIPDVTMPNTSQPAAH